MPMGIFTEKTLAGFAAALNADTWYRHWARDLEVTFSLQAGELLAGFSAARGRIEMADPRETRYLITGTEGDWHKALSTPAHAGYYDVFEGPCFLKNDMPRLLVASNAKAFDRMWKHLRAAAGGQGREWDCHV